MEYGLELIGHLQVTDIDEDLVKLANSLFNSEEVVHKPFTCFGVLMEISGVESGSQLFPCCQPTKPLF